MARCSRWLLVVAAGCAHAAKPAGPAADDLVSPTLVTPSCTAYELYRLSLASFRSETGTHDAFYAADTAARAHYDRGSAAGDASNYAEAAQEFLACGHEYRVVPEGDLGIAIATKNAQLCYKNSILAFANAGELEARGRALLDQAASDDPRAASYIRDELAKAPIDCAVKPRR